jgi:hypothetical protein
MREMKKTNVCTSGIALGLVAGGLLLNSPVQSCALFQPFRLEAIKNATMVFRGLVVDYSPRIGASPASIEFKIIEVYRGDRYDTLKLSWPNETFETPRAWNGPTELIVGAMPNQMPSALSNERLAVFQEPCSTAFLLEDTAATRDKVRALIGR